LQKQAKKAKY
jgi:hypothetical protein